MTTQVKFYKNIGLDRGYRNTYTHTSLSSQESFFNGIADKTVNDLNYQKKTKSLKAPGNVEDYENYSYLSFRNYDLDGKTFYCFIDGVEYLGEDAVEITFTVDAWQTYYFDVTIRQCYVEREHVTDDTIGLHSQDENLDVGEYVVNSVEEYPFLYETCLLVAFSEVFLEGEWKSEGGGIQTGIFNGCYLRAYDINSDLSVLRFDLDFYNEQGKADSVVAMTMFPKIMISNFSHGAIINQPDIRQLVFPVNKSNTIDGYVPKNNKLFTHPYNFLWASNNNGSSNIYRYEDFPGDTVCGFTVSGDISNTPTVLLYPMLHKGEIQNLDESLAITDYPQCAWSNDSYTAWLATNGTNARLGVLTSALALGVGIKTANPLAVASGGIGVAQSIGEFNKAKSLPANTKGQTSGSVNIGLGKNTFTFKKMSVSAEQARVIDNYFTRFGYKVNVLKTPNMTTKPNYNYVKCHEVNMSYSCPSVHAQLIEKSLLDGITFWRTSQTIGNF